MLKYECSFGNNFSTLWHVSIDWCQSLIFWVFSVDKSKSQLSLFCLFVLGCFLPTRKLKVLDHSRYEKLLTNIRKNDVILLHTTVVLDFQTCEWENPCKPNSTCESWWSFQRADYKSQILAKFEDFPSIV